MKTIITCIFLVIASFGYSQEGRFTPPKAALLSEITVNPAALDFDTTLVNQSATLQMVVKNTGFGVLAISNILSSDPVFAATPDSFSLVNNQEQIVDVTFTPDAAKSFYGNLAILNDSPTASVQVICTGTGKWPLGINPANRTEMPFTLYPNPVTDQLNLMTNLSKAAEVSITISDMAGKKRADIQLGTLEVGMHTLDLSDHIQQLTSGAYLFNIRVGDVWYAEKLIKL